MKGTSHNYAVGILTQEFYIKILQIQIKVQQISTCDVIDFLAVSYVQSAREKVKVKEEKRKDRKKL